MELVLMNDKMVADNRDGIIEMMRASDNDFLPPMSSRFTPREGGEKDGIVLYFEDMSTERMLGIFENGELLGFVTYVENVKNDIITKQPNIYLCTLIVKREARGRHLTRHMYDHLFNDLYADRSIFTRTWSANAAHIAILGKFGFNEFHRIPNDRGEGIDTVYFGLER